MAYRGGKYTNAAYSYEEAKTYLTKYKEALDALPTDPSRPLSEDRALLEKRWKERKPLYEAWADVAVRAATPEEAVGEIMKNE